MSGPVQIVLIVAAVGYLLVRRLLGEPAQAKRMLILPAVLTVVGLSVVAGQSTTPRAVLFLVVTVAISIALGALRGASVRISQRDGVAFIRYTWVTLVLWVVNLAVKFGANVVFGAVDAKDASTVGNSLLLTIGSGILAEGLVALYRALSAGHRVMWAQGRGGGPHRMSPMMDNLGRTMADRDADPYGDRGAAGWQHTRSDRIRDHRR